MKRNKHMGRSFDAHISELCRKNPEFAKALDAEMAKMPVSTQLAVARREAGLTQEQVARKLKVSQSAVAQVERADGNPTVQTVERIASLLGYHLTLAR